METYPTATLESVWAAFRESDRQRKESERILNEKFAETDRLQKETANQMKETDRQMKETDRKMKKVFQNIDSWSYNHGCFAEEYFFNSFENGKQNFFGEKFDEIEKNVKGIKKGFKDEYDILLINGQTIGIIEVKYKAHENDIPSILKKGITFRVNFPEYQNHKVYIGLASMAFYPLLEDECIKNGIAIVKQVGETVIINDDHLKVY